MKIALIGYGKMGHAVEEEACNQGFSIVARIHPSGEKSSILSSTIENADVCIDFTRPEAVIDNAHKVASMGKPLVIGTTGWDQRIEDLQKIALGYGTGIIYGQNFSLGVNLFFKISQFATELTNPYDYNLAISEKHHREKKDSPSGTALYLENQLLNILNRTERFQISSVRSGNSPGEHAITFDSPDDTIEIRHISKSRKSFARGAMIAAKWILGKQGLYHFGDAL